MLGNHALSAACIRLAGCPYPYPLAVARLLVPGGCRPFPDVGGAASNRLRVAGNS